MAKVYSRKEWTKEDYELLYENYLTMSNKELGKLLGRSNSAIQNKLKILGLHRPEKYTYNRRFFKDIDTEEKAYWLGFMYADGYVCIGKTNAEVAIELKVSDIDHLKKFNKSLNGNVRVTIREREHKVLGHYSVASFRLYSQGMAQDLVSQGCVERKTDKLSFPILQDKLYPHFLRGYFDGNGTICLHKKKSVIRAFFCSASYDLCVGIQKWLQAKNIQTSILDSTHKHKKENELATTMKVYKVTAKSMADAVALCDLMYNNSTIYLDRKYNKYYSLLDEYNVRQRVKRISKLKIARCER